jgi:hypothetical protein
MFSTGANPEQLAILTKAFDDYCQAHSIAEDADRESVAFVVMALFGGGATTPRRLKAALDRLGRVQQDNFAGG